MDAASAHRAVVAVPGGMLGPYVPTIMFSTDAAERRGARLFAVEWPADAEPVGMPAQERRPFVTAQLTPVLDRVAAEHGSTDPLLVGRSFGTQAAALAADRDLPAIWLCPPLTWDWVVADLRRATAPFLLVGGGADRVWDGALARALTPYVLEIADADHGLYVPGPLAASAAVLGIMATAVEQFLDEVVWPQADRKEPG